MSQININVGSSPNDGTGDSIRGAFINVNTNFTEVYNNIGNALVTVVNAYDKANAANVLAFNTGVGSNAWANVVVGYANNWANATAQGANGYAVYVGDSANSWSNTVSVAGNNFTIRLAAAGNNYINSVWLFSNTWTNTAAGSANSWANNLATAGNNWTRSTFATLMNVDQIYVTTNSAFAAANSALQNSTADIVFGGSLTVAGSIFDIYGYLREPVFFSGESNVGVRIASSKLIANNNTRIYVNIDNDGNFLANNVLTGATVTIIQSGSGQTIIRPNSPAVTLLSANSWLNVATQYSEVKATRVDSNTWVVTGDLKA